MMWRDLVACPECYSYCADTIENYKTKLVLPLEYTKMINSAVRGTKNVQEAFDNLINDRLYRYSHHSYEGSKPPCIPAERLKKDPECYKIFKNLDKYELPHYEYSDKVNDYDFKYP